MSRLLLLFVFAAFSLQVEAQVNDAETRAMDIVFCLDLSGSTNGLIDNVRENIWGIVNMAADFQPAQNLRIGIIGCSRPSFGKSNFYIKILSPLTADFDQLQAELYKLRSAIEKGDQFVSNALETAQHQMKWSKSENAVKIIFLVGNGSVSTGTSDYRSVVDAIREEGINLVPVYCLRSKPSSDQEAWQNMGRIAGNDCEQIVVVKRDPFVKQLPDQAKITALNKRLNQLVVPVTKAGLAASDNMKLCDNHALSYHPVLYENRLVYRVSDSKLQQTEKWDLAAADLVNPESLKQYDLSLLPDSLKTVPVSELMVKLKKIQLERAAVIEEIKKMLPGERQHFINSVLMDGTFEKEQVLERVLLLKIIEIARKNSIGLN